MYTNIVSYFRFETPNVENPKISLKPSINLTSLFIITVVGPIYEELSSWSSKVFSIVKNHPTDAVSIAGTLITNHTNIASTMPYLPVICALPATYKTLKFFLQTIASSNAKTLTKAAWATGIIYIGMQVPAAAALQWWTLSDVQKYYNGGPCSSESAVQLIGLVARCLKNPLSTTCAQIEGRSFNNQIFSRQNDAISITFKDYERICVISSTVDETATRLCFNPQNPQQHDVEAVSRKILTDNMAELQEGQRKMVIETERCAKIASHPAPSVPEKVTCIFTQLSSEDSTTKTCYDPQNPMDSVTVEQAPDVELAVSTTPASFVMKNVKPSNDKKSCSCET